MIYAPHTFELSLILSANNFNKWQSKAYERSEEHHRVYYKNDICYDEALKDKGVKIEYHNKNYQKRLNLS